MIETGTVRWPGRQGRVLGLSLVIDAVLAAATAVIFAYVGSIFARRETSREGRLARNSFAAWWFALAVVTAIQAVRSTLGAAGVTALGPYVVLGYLGVLPLVVALFGLLYYLVYIHTGDRRWFAPLAAAYAVMFIGFVWLSSWLAPESVSIERWQVVTNTSRELSPPMVSLLLVVLLGPVLVAAALYGSLVFRSKARVVRYRVGMTSGAFLLWFGSSAVAAATHLARLDAWPLVSRGIGLVATLMVLAAYRPPRAIRERLERGDAEAGREPPRRPLMLAPLAGWKLSPG